MYSVILFVLAAWLPSIVHCDIEIYPIDGPIYVQVGGTIELNCTITETSGSGQNPAHRLSWKHARDDILTDLYSTEVIGNTLLLRIENTHANQSGYYSCNDSDSGHVKYRKVMVGYPPHPPSDFHCISNNYEDMVCSWKISPQEGLPENWTLSFKAGLSNNFCTVNPKPEDKEASCNISELYSSWDRRLFPFKLMGANGYGFVNDSFHVTADDSIVKLSPLKNVICTPVNSKSLTVSYELDDHQEMVTWNFNVLHKVIYKSKWDANARTMIIKKLRNSSKQVDIVLTGLVPNTVYDISVNMKTVKAEDDRYWSGSKNAFGRTLHDVPVGIPEITSSSFYLKDILKTVNIYMKHLSEKLKNSPSVNYSLTFNKLDEDGSIISSFSHVSDDLVTIQSPRQLDLSRWHYVLVQVFNEVGVANMTAQLQLPPFISDNAYPKPDHVIVEKDMSRYRVSWRMETSKNAYGIKSVVYYWCQKGEGDGVCEDELNWSEESIDTTFLWINVSTEDFDLWMFGVAIETKDNHSSGIVWETCRFPNYDTVDELPAPGFSEGQITQHEITLEMDGYCTIRTDYKSRPHNYTVNFTKVGESAEKSKTVEANLNGNQIVLEDLEPGTSYSVIMKTGTRAGSSKFSEPVTITTVKNIDDVVVVDGEVDTDIQDEVEKTGREAAEFEGTGTEATEFERTGIEAEDLDADELGEESENWIPVVAGCIAVIVVLVILTVVFWLFRKRYKSYKCDIETPQVFKTDENRNTDVDQDALTVSDISAETRGNTVVKQISKDSGHHSLSPSNSQKSSLECVMEENERGLQNRVLDDLTENLDSCEGIAGSAITKTSGVYISMSGSEIGKNSQSGDLKGQDIASSLETQNTDTNISDYVKHDPQTKLSIIVEPTHLDPSQYIKPPQLEIDVNSFQSEVESSPYVAHPDLPDHQTDMNSDEMLNQSSSVNMSDQSHVFIDPTQDGNDLALGIASKYQTDINLNPVSEEPDSAAKVDKLNESEHERIEGRFSQSDTAVTSQQAGPVQNFVSHEKGQASPNFEQNLTHISSNPYVLHTSEIIKCSKEGSTPNASSLECLSNQFPAVQERRDNSSQDNDATFYGDNSLENSSVNSSNISSSYSPEKMATYMEDQNKHLNSNQKEQCSSSFNSPVENSQSIPCQHFQGSYSSNAHHSSSSIQNGDYKSSMDIQTENDHLDSINSKITHSQYCQNEKNPHTVACSNSDLSKHSENEIVKQPSPETPKQLKEFGGVVSSNSTRANENYVRLTGVVTGSFGNFDFEKQSSIIEGGVVEDVDSQPRIEDNQIYDEHSGDQNHNKNSKMLLPRVEESLIRENNNEVLVMRCSDNGLYSLDKVSRDKNKNLDYVSPEEMCTLKLPIATHNYTQDFDQTNEPTIKLDNLELADQKYDQENNGNNISLTASKLSCLDTENKNQQLSETKPWTLPVQTLPDYTQETCFTEISSVIGPKSDSEKSFKLTDNGYVDHTIFQELPKSNHQLEQSIDI